MKTLADYIALGLVRSLVFLMCYLPERAGELIARAIVGLLFVVIPRLNSVARRNLEIAFPEKSREEHEEIFRKSKRVVARNILGFARMPTCTKEQLAEWYDSSDGEAVLPSVRKRAPGTGVLCVTLHFGCFELGVQGHSYALGPVSYLARGFGLKRLDAWWNARREYCGNRVFSRQGGFREVVERLNRGEDVALLCDQNVKSNHAVFVDFFGHRAATTKTVALAVIRTGAPMVLGAHMELANGKLTTLFRELRDPSSPSDSREERVRKITAEMNRAMEELVREHPEQWFWIHRRWKTRPPGEAETMYAA